MIRFIVIAIIAGIINLADYQLVSAKPFIEPFIPIKISKALKKYPYSLAGKRSLVLRNKHIETIYFQGDGSPSRAGHSFRTGLIQQGIWLTLKNKGEEGWAKGKIVFKKPIKADVYNSIVLWVRSEEPEAKFWLTLQDNSWEDHSAPQARTDVITYAPGQKNQIVQVVIPYEKIFPDSPLNFNQVKSMGFEFGEHTTGNSAKSSVDILSIAFIDQKRELKTVKSILVGPKLNPVIRKEKKDPTKSTKRKVKRIDSGNDLTSRFKKQYSTAKMKMWRVEPTNKVVFIRSKKNVQVLEKPMKGSRAVGTLQPGISYWAEHSSMVKKKRWYSFTIGPGRRGWVQSKDLRPAVASEDN